MKTMLLKNGIFTMLMFAFILVALPSCDKDEETPEPTFKETLVGTWDIDSYLLDDDEWIGFILDEASITFQEPIGNSGIFIQEGLFADGDTMDLSGRYIYDEVASQVTMYYEGEPILADITFTGGNKMLWEGIEQEFPLVIKATKRK
ncbi:MAG: hypothetical protein IPN60_15465 [Saprospiraceae bacterium]|nr:hypothetical protein [Candidatus Opimibacter skivensis]MBL0008359.1 hypothetical protein [Candidatus Opimibacter skivensis]MBP8086438.1 hypothetical protein [Saprospiraceae bacterium]